MLRKLQRFLHFRKSEMKHLLVDAAVNDEQIPLAYDKFCEACDVCAPSKRPQTKTFHFFT